MCNRVSRVGAREFRSKTPLQHRFTPDLIRFIEVSSWTVTYSTKLEAPTIQTFPYRDSKLFILPPVHDRSFKASTYMYICMCYSVHSRFRRLMVGGERCKQDHCSQSTGRKNLYRCKIFDLLSSYYHF